MDKMFCFQCEQTSNAKGCTIQGVCGKHATSAVLQDEIVAKIKELAFFVRRLKDKAPSNKKVNLAMIEGLFTTVTNVNFDDERLKNVKKIIQFQIDELKNIVDIEYSPLPISVEERKQLLGEDIHSLQEIIIYGLKGAAAYYDHAKILGYEDNSIIDEFFETLDFLNKTDATAD